MSTSIGVFSVATKDREYEFKPSFKAMDKIGSGAEIVEVYAKLHGGASLLQMASGVVPAWTKKVALADYNAVLQSAILVMWCCCEDDISALTGSFVPRASGRGMVHRIGMMPQEDIIAMARGLIKHGLIGANPPKKKAGGGYSSEFKVADFVYMASAHLGLPPESAWGLTMTEFQLMMDAKYGQDKTPEPPKRADYDKAMAAAEERIKAAKAKRGAAGEATNQQNKGAV